MIVLNPCLHVNSNSFSNEQLYDQLVEYFYIKYPMIDNETHKKSASMISDVISDTIRNHVINSARTTRSGSISSKVAEFLLTPTNSLVGSNSNSFFDVCEDDTDLECVSSSKSKDVRRYKHNAVAESSSPVLSNGLPASPAHVDTIVVQPTSTGKGKHEVLNMKSKKDQLESKPSNKLKLGSFTTCRKCVIDGCSASLDDSMIKCGICGLIVHVLMNIPMMKRGIVSPVVGYQMTCLCALRTY